MSKQYNSGSSLNEKILKGMNVLADNVGTTLGPKGRNVILYDRKQNTPVVSKDGVTISRFVELDDPFENVGVQILKQAAEQSTRKRNENLGALLSIASALSEKADTRNWQTLPYNIHYARVPLPEGESSLELKVYSPKKSREISQSFRFSVVKGETLFYLHHNLESIPLEQ